MPIEYNVINDCNLTLPIFKAINKNTYKPIGFIGPSSLKQGVKQFIGSKLFPSKSKLASREYRMFTGTMFHIAMQQLLKDDPEFQCEIPVEVSFNSVAKFYQLETDVQIGGTCDLLHTANGIYTIYDYKTMATSQLALDDKSKGWEAQVNIYKWLMITSELVPKIDNLVISCFFMDWSPTKAIRSRNVNDIPNPRIPINAWTREEIEKYIYDKVTLIQKSMKLSWDEVEYCNDEERWCKPPKWSVCKIQLDGTIGNQLPGCGYDNEADANEKLYERIASAKKDEKFTVKKTGGISVLCENWCNLSREGHCNFLTERNKND